jgi:hypothetical protein
MMDEVLEQDEKHEDDPIGGLTDFAIVREFDAQIQGVIIAETWLE